MDVVILVTFNLKKVESFCSPLLQTEHKHSGLYRCEVFWIEALTQGVECGDVLPRVIGLVGMGLQHKSVHVIPEAEAWHLRRVHVNCEQILAAAQIHLQRDGPEAKV